MLNKKVSNTGRHGAVFVLLALMFGLLTACGGASNGDTTSEFDGVSQAEHDSVVAERDRLRAEHDRVIAERDRLRNEHDELSTLSEVGTHDSDITTLEGVWVSVAEFQGRVYDGYEFSHYVENEVPSRQLTIQGNEFEFVAYVEIMSDVVDGRLITRVGRHVSRGIFYLHDDDRMEIVTEEGSTASSIYTLMLNQFGPDSLMFGNRYLFYTFAPIQHLLRES